jgi:hypothetical protein
MVWHAGLPGWKTAREAGLVSPPPPAFNPSPAFAPSPAFPPSAPAFPQGGSFAPPQPGFGQPVYGGAAAAPAMAPMTAAPVAGTPVPPNMHWAVVMVLAWITIGLAGLIWAFKQAGFVKKIDRSSKATLLLVLCLVAMLAQVAIMLVAATSGSTSAIAAAGLLTMILNLVVIICGLVMIFSMRSSIVRYYNTVEPIGLRLSGVMTFFFSILYFQYHFSRIAEWKRTGRLG